MKRSHLLLLLAVVAIVGYFALGGTNFLAQSLVSYGRVDVLNGQPAWLVELSIDRFDEQGVFLIKYNDGKSLELGNGSVITPRSNFTFTVNPKQTECWYALQKRNDNWGVLPVTYYEVVYPEKHIFVEFSSSKTTEPIELDMAYPSTVLRQDMDGDGWLQVHSLGYHQGSQECPDPNFVVLKKPDGTPSYVSTFDWGVAKSQCSTFNPTDLNKVLLCFQAYWYKQAPAGLSSRFNNLQSAVDFDASAPIMKGITADLFATGYAQVQVTADAEYFDAFIWNPAPVADPNIISCSAAKTKSEMGGTFKFTVKNQANTPGTVYYTFSSNRVAFPATSKSRYFEAGQQIDEFASLIAGKTIGTESLPFEIKACSNNEFKSNCDTLTCNVEVVGDTEPAPVVCGNGKCEPLLGENSQTCAKDCPIPNACPANSLRSSSGDCLCLSGFVPAYDDKGNLVCNAEIPWWVYVAGLLIGLGLVWFLLGRKKR